MIEAGQRSHIQWGNGNWVFLDIGFSNHARSCGLLFGEGEPTNERFADAKEKIIEWLRNSETTANLVIEGPLSVCFDRLGNPKGRSIEKEGELIEYCII
jgi:hypothetical protein